MTGNPLYTATSLEDIATLFDKQKDEAVKAAERSATRRGREIQTAYAVTWRQAADILRATSLKEGNGNG